MWGSAARAVLIVFCQVVVLAAGCHIPKEHQLAGRTASDPRLGIEALIEKLAISQEPASYSPVYTPSRDAPRTDRRVIAYAAAEELKRRGRVAFPYLLRHLGDRRQSVAFRRVLPSTVGGACFCIVRSRIFALPEDYRGSMFRIGADGKRHERPYFSGPALFDPSTLEGWLKEREDRSLEQMQLEALEWLIAREKEIGFRTEEDRDRFLRPLERQLRRTRKKDATTQGR